MSAVDAERMSRLLLRIESNAHARGWDKPAALFVVYDEAQDPQAAAGWAARQADFGRSVRMGSYVARPCVPTVALQPAPHHSVFRLALNLSSDQPLADRMTGYLRAPGFLAMAFRGEGYGLESASEEERHAYGHGRNLADHPGARENRFVWAVDVNGMCHHVTRWRGSDAEAGDPVPYAARPDDRADDRVVVSGAVAAALLRIVEVVLRREPYTVIRSAPVGYDTSRLSHG